MRVNLWVLIVAQTISVTGSVSIVQIGGLVGLELAPRSDLATMPLTLMVLGTAAGTLLAARLMAAIGRRRGFVIGAAIGASAMLTAAIALHSAVFSVFVAAAGLFGISLAFTQQFRFAAAETMPADKAALAVGWVLFGSIGGALLGPQLIRWFSADSMVTTAGHVFGALAALLLLSSLVFATTYRDSAMVPTTSGRTSGPATGLAARPKFLLAVLAGAVSYGVMTLVMTATPISMHSHQGHSMTATGWVISSHVIAMYLPSLATGGLIVRFGTRPVMAAGTLLLAVASVAGLLGVGLLHYWWALVALGLGWNFLFVGATSLLTETYHPDERFRAQAYNDFCVFGASALASLASGALLHYAGWTWLLALPLPLLLAVLVAILRARGAPAPAR